MQSYVKEVVDSLQINTTLQSLTFCAYNSKSNEDRCEDIITKLSFTGKPLNLLNIYGKLYFSTLVNDDEGAVIKRVVNINVLCDFDEVTECLHENISLSSKHVTGDTVCLLTFGLYNNITVKELDLSFNGIKDNEAVIISDCLKYNNTLRVLNFSHNKITNNAAVAISDSLKYNKTLKEVNFSYNFMDFRGLVILSEVIKYVEYVDLSENKALLQSSTPWSSYCIIIKQCCVNKLTLCGDEGMKNYVKEVMDSLQVNTTLQSLTLCTSRSSIVDRQDGMLTNRKWSLYTSESSSVNRQEDMLSNRWKSHVAINGKLYLNSLVNGAEEVTNKRVVNIKVLYDIDYECLPETIGLSKKEVNDDKVCLLTFGLYNNTTVKKVDLSCNSITDAGAVIISNCLKHNNTLQKLNISQNKITDNGALAISNCLKHNNTLQKLNISQNQITDDGAVAIADQLKHNILKKLNLSQNHISFKGMNSLTKFIKYSTLLQYLNLSDNKFSPWDVYCTVIRHCCVNSLTLYGDEGMKEHICKIIDSLQSNATLQSLTLRKMGRVGLQLIKDILGNNTTLKELHVSRMCKKTEINIKFNCTKLILNGHEVVDINILYDGDCVECSSQVISLSNKNINDDAVDLIFFGLDNNTILQKIDLSFNNIKDGGTIALSECLMNNHTLKELKLTHNYINWWGMSNLSKSIKNPMPLAYVDLSGNSSSPWSVYCAVIRYCCVNRLTVFGDNGMKEYVTDMTDSLQRNSVLESLTLCRIGRNGIQLIKSILVDDITLKELNISWGSNANGTVLMKRQLKPVLHNNKEVCINILCDDYPECFPKTMNLSKKNIDDDAAYVIAFGLYQNTTVEKLDLSCNSITDDGMLIIKDCLKHNNTLQILNVSHNKITKEGAMTFSDCLIHSKTLKQVVAIYPPSKKN